HIHWYERTFPLGSNGTIDKASVLNNNTYYTNPGKSITHIINGMAGNIESHSTLSKGASLLNITCVLDQSHYGFSKLTIVNETVLSWSFVKGSDGSSGDDFTLIKKGVGAGNGTATATDTSRTRIETRSSSPTVSSRVVGGVTTVTEVVDSYTTYCPGSTTFIQGSKTYTVTEATTMTVTDCPCTVIHMTSLPGHPSSSGSIPGNGKSASGVNPTHIITSHGAGQQPTPGGPTTSPAGPASTTTTVPVARGSRNYMVIYLAGLVSFLTVIVML
ncbi:hypothetical protein QQS21_011456, partial [Conoideocrella luteorostrata]